MTEPNFSKKNYIRKKTVTPNFSQLKQLSNAKIKTQKTPKQLSNITNPPTKKPIIKVLAQEFRDNNRNSEIEEKTTTHIKLKRESAAQLVKRVKNKSLAKKSERKSKPQNRSSG